MMPLLLAGLFGCTQASSVPTTAIDPIYLEPNEEGGFYGFQTWQLYGSDDADYLCSVVVELEGEATETPCNGCTESWTVDALFLESDCEETISADIGFLALTGLALTELPDDIRESDPFPGSSVGSQVTYGNGSWELYGWAYPEYVASNPETIATDWDTLEPFQMWPAYVWEL